MKKFYFLLTAFLLANVAIGQIINFPDPNFKAKLLQPNVSNLLTIDANNNGEIEVSEAQLVFELNVSNSNISDLSGISYFTALDDLDCGYNLLVALDLNDNVNLTQLYASHNALTSIIINPNSVLYNGMDLSYNNLASFTVGSGPYFDTFDLSHNQLSSLVLDNSRLEYLQVSHNNLSSIQIIGEARINYSANFNNNQFSLLDLTGLYFNPDCTITLGNNVIDSVLFSSTYSELFFNSAWTPGNISYSSNNTFFDLGNFRGFRTCQPENEGHVNIGNSPNLKHLILKNGINHTEITCDEGGAFQIPALDLNITNCPNLSFICVDEIEMPFIQTRINSLGLQNQVQVNSYCSFTPGGTYYTVNGATQLDYNSNGCDSGDFNVPNQQFSITDGTQSGTIISDESGNYTINVGPGTHTITPIIQNPAIFTISPPNVTVSFPAQSSPVSQNFCIAAGTPLQDFDITLLPVSGAVQGMDSNYKIFYTNTGNVVDSGTVVLKFQDDVLDFISASMAPTTNAGGTLTWSFTNLMPFETRTINLTFNLNGPMETPPLNPNDVLSYTTSIGEIGAPEPYANNHLLNQTVVNSLDPNDKTCLDGTTITPEMVGNYVHYIIRFENTGTANAQNIVVKDMIDISKFDVSTMIPLNGSHSFITRITETNKVEFIFENINLPFDDANNDGYVAFKIKTKPTLVLGDTFSNTASIYFDYNFPIVTDPAVTTIGVLGLSNFEFSNYFAVYPNPANDVLNIQSKQNIDINSISIYNMLGQLLLVIPNAKDVSKVNVSNLSAGNYFIKVNSDKGTSNGKFVKR